VGITLRRALRLGNAPCLALAGAGGKTTALFRLAREYPDGAIVTSSTHFGAEQPTSGDHHFIVSSIEEIEAIFRQPLPGVSVVSGPAQGERMAGLDAAGLNALQQRCIAHSLPLFIEADGSRRLPLKAPAEHEPAIPDFVDTVVWVAGLSALGQPLGEAWVHRPPIFAALAGLELGGKITAQGLARVMLHPQGGLKNIPAAARRMALLNQADTSERQAQAQGLARRLLEGFDAALIASLKPAGTRAEAPFSLHAAHERIAAIILAAGEAQRMGQPKALLPWRGEPFVRHAVNAALAGGLSPVVVIGGEHVEAMRAALDGLDVSVRHNPDWREGQSASIRMGVKSLPASCGGAVFLLADQPQVSAALIQSLVEMHAATSEAVTAPLIDGQRGNPVLFDRETFAALEQLKGDVGGRAIFSRYPPAWLPWHDAAMLLDVDSPQDYQRLLEME
jgi:molybdenum cofactor cytidylyltransferase